MLSFTWFLLYSQPVALAAQSYQSLNDRIQLKQGITSVAGVIETLKQQTSYTFVYDPEYLKKCALPDGAAIKEHSLSGILTFLDQNSPVDISFANNTVAIRKGKADRQQVEKGHVTGKVVDNKNQPLPGVTIRVTGGKGAVTQVDGTYDLELEPGTYTLEFSFISYNTRRITEVTVKAKGVTPLNVAMTTSSSALKEVVVTANYRKASVEGLYALQKNNAAVSDGISAEQIAVTPDNNAAQVLKRVSGLTVQDDKFVTVRGLSDRYNNVLLNGAALPSTEPNRRNFSFDIIPAGLIDNIIVNKTATPDMPAEFAGGLVQVTTKDIPDFNYASVTVGSGYNTNTVGRDMYSTKRGKNDYLGYDDGNRNWWRNGTWDRFQYAQLTEAGNAEKASEMNRRIPNNWGLYKYNYSPVQNYQLNAGRKISLRNGARIGLTAGVMYRHEEKIEDEERRTYLGDQNEFTGATYNFRSAVGGLLNVAYMKGGHKIALKNLYNHLFSTETNVYYGTIQGFGGSGDVRSYTGLTLINDIRQHRLEGEHVIGKKGIKLEWNGDMVDVRRSQPDTRNVLGFRNPTDPEGFYYYNLADGTGFLGRGASIFNSYLKENRYNWSANVTLPFTVAGQKQKIKAGYAGAYREADFQSVGLFAVRYTGGGTKFEEETKGLPDYEVLSPQYFKPGYLHYFLTGPRSSAVGDDYGGIQRLHAGYAMTDLNFLKHFRFIGGVRMENNHAEVNTVTYRSATGRSVDSTVVYDKIDWLPSANLIYNLTPKMNVRLAYSETLSRPDFRERSPFIYYEFKERTEYKGAYGLKDARVRNMDLRYEFYPGVGEVISISGFYKKFESPVELVVGGNQGGAQVYYYFNLRSSTALGIEMDFRKSFDFINRESRFWRNLFINGNGSWMKANVRYNTQEMLDAANGVNGGNLQELPPDSRNRPLQGLSPYVINAGIGYVGKPVGINVSYNRYGRRIIAGGLYPYADQYENPRDVLDLQLSTRLLKDKLDIRLNLSDLLQQHFIIYDNVKLNENGWLDKTEDTRENVNNDPKGNGYNKDLDYTRYKNYRGTNVTLNVTYNF
jgi:TonB-dependent receptor